MAKGRTLQAKRKQRRRQALRKKVEKLNKRTNKTSRNEAQVSESSYGVPTSPPSTPPSYYEDHTSQHAVCNFAGDVGENAADGDDNFVTQSVLFDKGYCRESINKEDADMLAEIEEYSPSERYQALKHLFMERTEVLHGAREQVDELHSEMEDLSRECGRKIKEVRNFWKDKILGEGSRSGKIVKTALQKK